MRIEQRIRPAKVSPSEFISAFETEWNWITHLSQSSAAASVTYRKIVNDLFACQEAKRDFLPIGLRILRLCCGKLIVNRPSHLLRGKGAYPEPPLQP
jgi:hypothetical protein